MDTMSQEPRLFHSNLTGRIYIATKYRAYPDGSVVAQEKFDVTDEFKAIEASREQQRQGENEEGD